MVKKIATFGEIMLRLSKPDYKRLFQGRQYNENYGGSEANVAVSLAMLGDDVEFITRVPSNQVGKAACMRLNEFGVSTKQVVFGGDRLGSYFFEEAVSMRNSSVVYDRANSSFCNFQSNMMDWNEALKGVEVLHTSGISCAVSDVSRQTTMDAIAEAHKKGACISFDINYRKNLWSTMEKANNVLSCCGQQADVIFGDQGEYEIITGMPRVPFLATDENYEMDLQAFERYLRQTASMFPKAKKLVMAARNQISSTHHTLTGFIFADGRLYHTRIYDIAPIIDPMGVGDAFCAAYIHAFTHWPEDNQHCLDFSLAASAMKNNIVGDFNLVTETEIEHLMEGNDEGFKVYDELQ